MKHIKTILLFLSVSCWSALYAQTPSFEWVKSMGGTTNDQGRSIATDEHGYVYITGEFRNTVDFDPGLGTFNIVSNGAQDIFIQKLDSLGGFVWAKSIGGTGGDQGNSISVDTSGFVYVTGQFQGTVDFDPGVGTSSLTSSGSTDVFVQKLDTAGNLIWAKSFGGTITDVGNSISTDVLGNVYTTGYFEGSADFRPGAGATILTANGGYDIFVHKLNPNGNFLWAKAMGGTAFDYGRSIAIDSLGDVYTTGYFSGTADFYSGTGTVNLTSSGGQDIFVQKLSSSGSFLWVKKMGGVNNDYGHSIALDSSGNIYTTGYFSGTADFDPGLGTTNLTSTGSNDIFVHKLDPSGNLVWAKNMGGTGSEGGNNIVIDASANVYITGWFEGTADFDPNAGITSLTSSGNNDIFVQKLNTLGDLIWAKSMGGVDADLGNGIATDNAGNVYIVGSFNGTADFDPSVGTSNLTSNGNLDVFVQKLSQCPSSSSTDIVSACASYTWIDGNTYTSSNSTATHILTNAAGCDSVITLNLAINNSTTSTDVISACASYTWIDGNTYTSSNTTATHTLTNAAGCDSIVTLNLTIHNSTTSADVVSACASYTWIDGNTYTSSNSTATHTLTNAAGCDSVVTLNLTINNSTTGTDVVSACASYTWIDGNTYTSSNSAATHILTNAAGCDSVVALNLTINNSTTSTDIVSACASYTWIDGITYTSSNSMATHILTNTAGCDSVVTLNLTINNSTTGTDVISACDNYTWIDGNTYTSSNSMATHTLTNTAGCDSVVTLNLTINNSTTGTDVVSACASYTWIDGITYTSSNSTATHTLTNASGCDSLVTLNLTINNSTTSTDIVSACDNYTWIDGNTYTSTNSTATHILTNAAGCDSVVTLNLTINNSTTSTDVVSACASYTWIDGITYTSSNSTATHILTNTAGCDSVATLNLTINNSTAGTDVISACASYTWIDGITYTSSNNTATHTLTNAAGCDSVVTLNLTINNSTTGTDVISACASYTWIDGNTYTSSNSTATHILTNAAGCDSVVTIQLTINSVVASVTQTGTLLTANDSGATYQWLDCSDMTPINLATNQSYTPTNNGNYAVIVTNNGCTDTSMCYTVVGIIENNFGTKLLLYPNPTDGNFSIDLGDNHNFITVKMTDLNGKLIQSKQYNNAQVLNLKIDEPAGIYFLIIESTKNKAVIRLVKE